jgi:hypothetical protein
MSVLPPYGLNVRFVQFWPGETNCWDKNGVGSSLYDHSRGCFKKEKVQSLAFAILGRHLVTFKNPGGLGDSKQ